MKETDYIYSVQVKVFTEEGEIWRRLGGGNLQYMRALYEDYVQRCPNHDFRLVRKAKWIWESIAESYKGAL